MKSEMKPIKETIPLEEARQLIAESCRRIDRAERVRLLDANGRVAAAAVASTRDVPPFSRAGMDGYAVRAEDTFGASRYEPKTLRVIDKIYTGQVPSRTVEAGTAIEIATGAPMPAGADAVVMLEVTQATRATEIEVLRATAPGENVLRAGEEAQAGEMVLNAGHWLRAQDVGALAALGLTQIEVAPRPRVAFEPMWILTSASVSRSAWASVFTAMNSTPVRPDSTMRFTAFVPPPPTPTTLITAR